MKNLKLVALLVSIIMVVGLFAGCGQKAEPAKAPEPTKAAEPTKAPEATKAPVQKVILGVAIRSLSNPYLATVVEGAELFAKTLPAGSVEVQVLACEGSDEKQINDIKALIARGGKNVVLYVDPNQAPDALAIADICEEAGVYWTCAWNKPDEISPLQYPHWVMFQSPDNIKSGHDIAIEMFKQFKTPNKGKILAIQGMLANTAAIDRFKGLKQALKETPGVELLADQDGEWNPQKALTIAETWLAKYKDIDGIWVANDGMAISVVQALKAKGLNGKVKVVGVDGIGDAVTAIKAGDMTATVGSNGWLQGGFGLAYAYAALKGDIDTKTMDQAKRMINTKATFISKDTVGQYEKDYITNKPVMNFKDLWSNIEHPMEVKK